MDTPFFAKFSQDKYLLNIHSNRFLKTIFEKLWLLFMILFLMILISIVVSVVIAGNFLKTIELATRIFSVGLAQYEACNSDSFHAAACMINLGGFVLSPFLIVLAIIGLIILGLSSDVPNSLSKIATFGRIKIGDKKNKLRENSADREIDNDKKITFAWGKIKEKYRIHPHNSLTYTEDFESALLSPWRYILFSFWLLISYRIATQMMEEIGLQNADLPILMIGGYVFEIIIPIFVAYFISAWTWFIFIVGYYLSWLPKIFKLDIQPSHGDNCGGLKKLGDICFKMALSIILPAILIGFWGVTGTTLKISRYIPTFALFNFIVIVILLVMSFWAFFYPLFSIHKEMAKTKNKVQEERISQITEVESRLRILYK